MNRILFVGVLAFLVYQLAGVGLSNILQELPTAPLFYLIFVGMYLGLPVAETFIYRLLWGLPFLESVPVLIRKRVYNKDVLNYSGEAHLYMWARTHVDRPARQLLLDMKDNTIISSLTSLLVAVVLLSTFLFTGLLPFEALFENVQRNWVIGGAFCLVLLVILGLRFRRSVISMPATTAVAVFGLHIGRLLLVKTLQILQWMVVMPDVPLSAWFSLLSLQIVINQLPLLPSKDLVVLGASTELSVWLEISEAAVAGMLGVTAILDKAVNLALFTLLSSRTVLPIEQPDPGS